MEAIFKYVEISAARNKDEVVVFITQYFEISLLGTQFNALKIIAIFFWKQAYSSFKWKGAKCVLIRYLPYVKWRKITEQIDVTSASISTPTEIEIPVCNDDEARKGRDNSESISLYDDKIDGIEIVYKDISEKKPENAGNKSVSI